MLRHAPLARRGSESRGQSMSAHQKKALRDPEVRLDLKAQGVPIRDGSSELSSPAPLLIDLGCCEYRSSRRTLPRERNRPRGLTSIRSRREVLPILEGAKLPKAPLAERRRDPLQMDPLELAGAVAAIAFIRQRQPINQAPALHSHRLPGPFWPWARWLGRPR